jgi:hypothetical protein
MHGFFEQYNINYRLMISVTVEQDRKRIGHNRKYQYQ